MKLKLLALAPLAALLTAPAIGQVAWTNAASDNDLANPANWSPPTGFTSGNNSWDVNQLGANRAELSSTLTMERDLRIGDDGGQGEFFINGGNLTVTRDMRHGRAGLATGYGLTTVEGTLSIGRTLFIGQGLTSSVFNLNSGSVTVGDTLNVAHQTNGNGSLNIAGGTFTVQSGGAVFADAGGGISTTVLNISGNGTMGVTGNVTFAAGGGGATSTIGISDNGSLTGSNNITFAYGDDSTAVVNISGGALNASTGFIGLGQGAGAEVTVNMSGGEINTDRMGFANNATATATLNMTGGTINLLRTTGTATHAGGLRMQSAGAALNIGGDAVINAQKLYINEGGLLTLSGNALINISGSDDGTNFTFDFAPAFLGLPRGEDDPDWSWDDVLGQIEFASLGASIFVAGSGETIGDNTVSFLDLFNEAIVNDVFLTSTSFDFEAGYDAGGNFTYVTIIPEPSIYALIFGAGTLLLVIRRRNKEAAS